MSEAVDLPEWNLDDGSHFPNSLASLRRILEQQLRAMLGAAVPPRRYSLRSLALFTVSRPTLLRSTGPLGLWSNDPKERAEKISADREFRQIAIISSGMMLGIVIKTRNGYGAR